MNADTTSQDIRVFGSETAHPFDAVSARGIWNTQRHHGTHIAITAMTSPVQQRYQAQGRSSRSNMIGWKDLPRLEVG